jgi:hypothetical protein
MQPTETPVPMTDIHDIKPLEILVADWSLLFYILGAVLILAVIGASIYYWKKARNRKRNPVEVPIPPHEAALRLLNALADVENLDAKTFYFSLSSILRSYIQARYAINALEMTTEELLPKIDILNINREILSELKALLRTSDPVKFAGVPASVSKMRQDLDFVINFVKQTEEKPVVINSEKRNTGMAN